jgi:hypothetical protein
MSTLPMVVEDIDATWLSNALGRDVTSVRIREVLWGTATKVLLDATVGDGDIALCVKGGFIEEIRPLAAAGYLVEARFFADIAPKLDARLPRCWYSGADPDHDQAVVILDDLTATGVRFGCPTVPWTPDLVALALELQAAWHAATWGGQGLSGQDWLADGPTMIRHNIRAIFSEDSWNHHLAMPKAAVIPEQLRDRRRVLHGIERMWALDDTDTVTALTHGDAHLGNTYVEADGSPGFLDWQSASIGPWSSDVGYFLGGALSIEDRRNHEQGLLREYLNVLSAHGVAAPDFDDAWLAVRRRHLHGLCWLLIPEQMQPTDYSAAMAERYAAAAMDHDTLELLAAT